MEALEIECIADTDGGSVVPIAPGDIVAVFQPGDTRVIAMLKWSQLRVIVDPLDRLVCNLPVDTILAKPCVQVHLTFLIIAAKDPGKTIPEGNDRAVEDAVGRRNQVPRNDGVSGVAPHQIIAIRWFIFPGWIFQ